MLFRNRFLLLLALAALLAFLSLSLQFCKYSWAAGSWDSGGSSLGHRGPDLVGNKEAPKPLFFTRTVRFLFFFFLIVSARGEHL
jgi:hypothetical protein